MSIERALFGVLSTGEQVEIITISNGMGAFAKISTLGCAIVSVVVPDRHGVMKDVVLGYDTPEEYRIKPKYIGAIIGRYCNRIAGGRFQLNGEMYQLECNNNGNSIHGGFCGFDKRIWTITDLTSNSVSMSLFSPDGDAGYPGNLHATVTYSFDETNTLLLQYKATSDKDTVCSLTNHCYFNLGGHDLGTVDTHEIQVHADSILEVNPQLLPTGRYLPLAHQPYDLRQPVMFADIHSFIGKNRLITDAKGLDFNYVLSGNGFREASVVRDLDSGRKMTMYTDMPGVQVYSAGNLTNDVSGKGGCVYPAHSAFCLETQFFPDSPNHPEFPSTVLRVGETYCRTTAYQFSVE